MGIVNSTHVVWSQDMPNRLNFPTCERVEFSGIDQSVGNRFLKNSRRFLTMALGVASVAAIAQTVVSGDTVGKYSGTYNCQALNSYDIVKISLSANNGAAFACGAKNAGLAVANAKGTNNVYSTSTAAVAIIESRQSTRITSVLLAAAAADIQAAARLAEAGT